MSDSHLQYGGPIDPRLIDYVRGLRRQGYSEKQIYDYLINYGYPPDLVSQSIIEAREVETQSLPDHPHHFILKGVAASFALVLIVASILMGLYWEVDHGDGHGGHGGHGDSHGTGHGESHLSSHDTHNNHDDHSGYDTHDKHNGDAKHDEHSDDHDPHSNHQTSHPEVQSAAHVTSTAHKSHSTPTLHSIKAPTPEVHLKVDAIIEKAKSVSARSQSQMHSEMRKLASNCNTVSAKDQCLYRLAYIAQLPDICTQIQNSPIKDDCLVAIIPNNYDEICGDSQQEETIKHACEKVRSLSFY